MSDDGNGGLHLRQAPRTRSGDIRVADLTTMVRVPGRPAGVRVYTDAEHGEAARYAIETGGEVVSLPLAPPAGYIAGADGTLIPVASPVADDLATEPPTAP